MKKKHQRINKVILQRDAADCGVACIQNILGFYNVAVPGEKIRHMSGTAALGTTLYGLSQAASQLGFDARGIEVNSVEDLKTLEAPCILYTIKENRHHYIVLYYWNGKSFVAGDPATGKISLTEDALSAIWPRKVLLWMKPTDKLLQHKNTASMNGQWFLGLLRKHVNILAIVAVLGILLSALNLSTAIFSQKLVDKLLSTGDHTKIYLSVILLAIILFFKGLVNYIRGLILAKQSKLFNTELTLSFYEKMLDLPKPFFDSRKTGDMVSRLNDTNRIQQAVGMLAGEISIQVLLLIAALIIISIYSHAAGLVSLGFLPAIFFIVRHFQPRIIEGQTATMAAYAINESNYIDNIKGIGIIKLFNRQPYFLSKAKELYTGFQAKVFIMGNIRVRFNLVIETAAAIFLCCLISTGVTLVLQKRLQAGELIAILQLGIIVMQTSTSICLTNIQLQEAKIAFERIAEFTGIEPEPAGTSNTTPLFRFTGLSIHDLDFGFPGRPLLLKAVSLQTSPGEITAITGESGQGKSTLFQLLQKFYHSSRGSIMVNGQQLEEHNTRDWRNMLGVVTQEPLLFSGTVAENIIMGSCTEEKTADIIRFCRETGLDHYLEKLPKAYHTPIGEGGMTISGGQKQLICLARCLYHRPQLLLLDEPTASMDKHTELFVIRLLEKIKTQCAIIVISHKDALTNIADTIYELHNGELTVLTSPTRTLTPTGLR